jgi:hypothetical protein
MQPQMAQAQQMSNVRGAHVASKLTESWARQPADEEVAWNLERQVAHEEDGYSSGKLVRGHIEINHNSLNLSCAKVLAVNVVENVKDAHDRSGVSGRRLTPECSQNHKVGLAHKLLLDGLELFL